MSIFCINTKMAHYEGGAACTEFAKFTLSGVEKEKQCYWVPQKEVVFDEQVSCGDNVEIVKDLAEDFKSKIYQLNGWHVKTEQYFKSADGTKQEIKEKPFSLCGFLFGEENCWDPRKELKTFSDENSTCSERYVMGFLELSKEWVCYAKKKD